MLDRASYFYAKDIWDFVSGKEETEYIDDTSVERVCGESLQQFSRRSLRPQVVRDRSTSGKIL